MKKIMLIMMVALFIANASAIGIGFEDQIEIAPGQTVDKILSLQNLPEGNGNIIFTGVIEEGSEIVSFPHTNEFTVEDGKISQGTIQISIPSDTNIGQTHNIKILFSTSLAPGEKTSDTVQFSSGAEISFDVIVVEEAEEEITPKGETNSAWITWIIVIAIILIIAYLFLRKKR